MKDQVAPNDTQPRPTFLGMDRRVIVLIFVIKAIILIFGVVVFLMIHGEPPTGILSIWTRWDAEQYIAIARDGYQATVAQRFSLVFYPLFPWLTRFVALAVRDYPASAILVSTFASIAAGLLLRQLVRLDFSDHIANKAVWFLFIFPTSYFLHIGYTESLFLALATGSFLTARRERWWLAGVLGAMACLTRANGVILIPPWRLRHFNSIELTGDGMGAGFGLRLWRSEWVATCYLISISLATRSSFWFSKERIGTSPWPGHGLVLSESFKPFRCCHRGCTWRRSRKYCL
jgi:hypothetical protein